MEWWSIVEITIGATAGGIISWFFSRRSSRELYQRTEELRRLTVTLMRILDGAGLIKVDAWDPVTGEPKSYPQIIRMGSVTSEAEVLGPTVTQEDPPAEDKGADEEQGSR